MTARIGPHLRELCDIRPEMPPSQVRRQLTDHLSTLVTELPHDLQTAVQAAFGMPPASESRFLRERMEWLGQVIQRDPRTATRRVEAGLALLAEQLADDGRRGPVQQSSYAPDGWYVEFLRATLALHVDPVRLLETRRIAVTQEGLDHITVSWSIPPVDGERMGPGRELGIEMIYGGELVKDESVSTPTYWSGRIELPRRLALGERHEYQVQVTSLSMTQLRPYYVLSPLRRFDEFELRAKFGRSTAPGRIWQLDGVPFRLIDERCEVGRALQPDAVGEVVSRFRNLRPGLSYGLQWHPPDRAGAVVVLP